MSTAPENVAPVTDLDRIASQQPEPELRPAPQESVFSDELKQRAEQFGFSDDELSRYSPEQVEGMVDRIEQQAFTRFNKLRGGQQPPWEQPPQGPPWQQQAPTPQGPPWQQQAPQLPPWQQGQQQPPQQQPPQFKIELDSSEYDEGLIKQLKAMDEHYQQHFAQLNASLQQQQQFVYNQLSQAQQQAHDDHTRWFDKAITGLGDDFNSVFGQGPIDALPQGSNEVRQRQEAYDQYLNYLEFNGLPLTTKNDELLARFVRITVGSNPTILQKQLSERLKRNAGRTIGRPSGHRNTMDEAEINPETGMSQATIDRLNREIADRLSV